MINLVYGEFFKLKKSTSFKVCILISLICSLALAFISNGLAEGIFNDAVKNSSTGVSDIFIMSVLGPLMVGIFICSDFDSKTIHDLIACGNGRKTVVASKAVIYVFIITLITLPYAIVSLVCSQIEMDFIAPFNFSTFTNVLGSNLSLGKAIVLVLSGIIVFIGKLSFCIPLAFKIRKPVIVMGIGVASGYIIELLLGFLDDVSGFNKIIRLTPFSKDAILSANAEADIIIKVIAVSIIFMIIMSILAYGLFKKSEIK